MELPAGSQRIDDDASAVRGEDRLAEMHVPVVLARPSDVLRRHDDLTHPHHGVHVPVPEVADVNGAARAGR